MAVQKSERLLNLLIMLLVQRHYVSGPDPAILYPARAPRPSRRCSSATRRSCSSLGVPIEVGSMDVYFDDEPGYRIRPDQLALPDVELTADEAAVIGLATRVWEHARLAEATTEAVRSSPPSGAHGRDRPRHRPTAAQRRRAVVRRLLGGGPGPHPGRVRLPPLRRDDHHHAAPAALGSGPLLGTVVRRRSRHRPRRGAGLPPLRVQGQARKVGRPGPSRVPPGTDVRATTVRRAPEPTTTRVVLLVREDAGLALRRDASSVEEAVVGPDGGAGWDRLVLTRRSDAADELLGYGADVYVEEPAELRAEVVRRLTDVVERSA